MATSPPQPLPFFYTLFDASLTLRAARPLLNTHTNHDPDQLSLLDQFFQQLSTVEKLQSHSKQPPPCVIAVEALDGCGKTTITKAMHAASFPFPISVHIARTPPESLSAVRHIFDSFGTDVDEHVTRAFYAATNYFLQHHLFETSSPYAVWVVDRYQASTAAYTAALYRDEKTFAQLPQRPFRMPPDLMVPRGTLILCVDDEVRKLRITKRVAETGKNPWDQRLSSDRALAERIQKGLFRASSNVKKISANSSLAQVESRCSSAICDLVLRSFLAGGPQCVIRRHNLLQWLEGCLEFSRLLLKSKEIDDGRHEPSITLNLNSKEIDVLQAKLVGVDDERNFIRIEVNNPKFHLDKLSNMEVDGTVVTCICEIKLHGWLYQAFDDSAIGWNIETDQIEFGVWGGEVGEVGEVRELPVNSEAQQKKLSRVNGCEWRLDERDHMWYANAIMLNSSPSCTRLTRRLTDGCTRVQGSLPTTIAITGTHCAGKATIGQMLAEKLGLGWQFCGELGDNLRDDEAIKSRSHRDGYEVGWDERVWLAEQRRDNQTGGCNRVVETWHVGNYAWATGVRSEDKVQMWERLLHAVKTCVGDKGNEKSRVIFIHLQIESTTSWQRHCTFGEAAKRLPMRGDEAAECKRLHAELCVGLQNALRRMVECEKMDIPLLLINNNVNGCDAMNRVVEHMTQFVRQNVL